MAKYHASPWGDILGGLGDFVGGKWKGIYWTRKKVWPTQRGTLELYRLLKEGLISPERFSFKQMNIRRLSLQILGYIGRMNMSGLINIPWADFVAKRRYRMTALNAFVRFNVSRFYHSMPHFNQEFDPTTNSPDTKEILMSNGDLEPAVATGSVYDTATGKISVSWNPACYTNGKSDDYAYVVVLKKPLLEAGTWYPSAYLYGRAELPVPPAVVRERGHSGMEITIAKGLSAADLTGYVFFRDRDGVIGWSKSAGVAVSPA